MYCTMLFRSLIYKRSFLMMNSTIMKRCYSNTGITSVSFDNGMKTVTMCDHKTRNSLSQNMMETLINHITEDQNNKALRVIVLAAEGPVFSAGHNLKELDFENGKLVQEKVFKTASRLMYSIIDSPVPVIAKVDGLAAAAGCQLVAQCDFAVCTEKSKFSTPGVSFGIFCSTPGIALARSIPKSLTLKMLFTGEPILSSVAKQYGLVTDVCSSPEELDKIVNEICSSIKSKSRSVVELGKRFYYKQVQIDVKKAYEVGGQTMVENLQMKDGQEGIKSFKEKRKPTWSHEN